MATIRRRGERWQVQVRRRGAPATTRSLLLRSDAVAWSRQMELAADRRGLPTAHKMLEHVRVAELLTRYRDEVVPQKRGCDREACLLNAFLRSPLAGVAIKDLTTAMVSAYCSRRLAAVKPGTVRRELDVLRHAFEVARRDWELPITNNAFGLVKRPKGGDPRTRRIDQDERNRLLAACARCRIRTYAHSGRGACGPRGHGRG